MTEIIRADSPRRSSMAAVAIGGLVVGILWFTALTIVVAQQVMSGVSDVNANAAMGVFLGVVCLLFAVALDVYRKEFMPDELIHKIRRPKIVPPRTFR
ncbi:MAG TPA: hypothetical protein VJ300_02125 [Thermoplasmata archaeon]|nr:hypothetical protein [Thermoplasmata archaeon]